MVLGLFAKRETITTADMAKLLGLSDRMARNLSWNGSRPVGWSYWRPPSDRVHSDYRKFIGNPSAVYRQWMSREAP